MKASGKGAKNPLKESFLNAENRKMVILALFGATAGQGVVWYTGQFYAMNFTKGTIGIEATQTEYIVGIALVLATPFFIVFGALSDRVGRKGIMMAGCLLALVLWYPIYSFMSSTADVKDPTKFVVDKVVAVASTEKTLNPKTETLTTDPDKGTKAGTQVTLVENITFTDGTTAVKTTTTFTPQGASQADPAKSKFTKIKFPSLTHPPAMVLTLLIWVQVLFVTMVYGPIAAFLVELFPTRIRYTSMSLPYHIGNGVFGGVVPLVGQFMIGWTGNKFAGLWYPMAIALITLIIGTLLIRENRNVRMHDEH
jgi:MHS family proline/betaine transporter-like MFS transporter